MSRTAVSPRLLSALGLVAIGAGARGVLAGTREAGEAPASPAVDSEYRFYASWYPVAGAALLRAARDPETGGAAVAGVIGGLSMAVAGRLLSIRAVGRPRRSQLVLLGIEVALIVVLSAMEHLGRQSRSH